MISAERVRAALGKVAELLEDRPALAPVFARLDAELTALEAAKDPVLRARARLAQRKATG